MSEREGERVYVRERGRECMFEKAGERVSV